jgi:hypothetical protein
MIEGLISFLIYIVVVILVLALIDYAGQALPLPPVFRQIIRVLVILVGILVLLFFLFAMVGYAPAPRLGR